MKQVVGIDLGTSNSAVARVHLDTGALESVAITQRVSESEVASRPLLPSFLYLPGPHELPPGSLSLPWDAERTFLVGEFARVQGSRVPGRVVVSAKSWLAHRQADPSEPLLPYDGAADSERISPVEASRRYLEHLRESWDSQWPDNPLGLCEVVLTVPASFDELARELTLAAARQAGLEKVSLLEEPQAAFYSWLQQHGKTVEAPEGLAQGDQILVCDIGGGTTDFTLIEYGEKGLTRVAVGEHLMLGGDNLDIAIAYMVEPRLGGKLDVLQWGVLRNECRRAKEILLGDDPPELARITVPGSGAKLLAGALTAEISRAEVEALVLDGFFPVVGYGEGLKAERRLGLKEFGLPYASDPAVPRHLSSFLRRHAAEGKRPNKILFNGGACRPLAIRQRVLSILEGWFGHPVEELLNPESDQSVARGAAYYNYLKKTGGRRIGGGTARSYYLQLGGDGNQAVCVIPRNLEAGQRLELPEPVLHLTVERPVRFPLYSSSVRVGDKAGEVVEIPANLANQDQEEQDFQILPAMETVVRAAGIASTEVPVLLSSEVTEVGTLSIGCRMVDGKRRFQLEFSLRGDGVLEGGAEFPSEIVAEGRNLIVEAFRRKPTGLGGGLRPRSIMAALESHFGLGRNNWSLPLLRALWEGFLEIHPRRRVDPEYEASWLNGVGYCLRPGTGSKLDQWRVEKTAAALDTWLQFPKSEPVRLEFWVMWRRLAAGLSAQRQEELWRHLSAVLIPGRKHWKTRVPQQRGSAEDAELLRLAVSLERIPTAEKAALGDLLAKRFQSTRDDYWRLARVGARQPFGGGPQHAVPPEVVWPWIELILSAKWPDKQMAGFALAQMARQTGDRRRDLAEEQFARVRNRLLKEGLDSSVKVLEGGETGQEAVALLGEALPVGLRLGRAAQDREATAV